MNLTQLLVCANVDFIVFRLFWSERKINKAREWFNRYCVFKQKERPSLGCYEQQLEVRVSFARMLSA